MKPEKDGRDEPLAMSWDDVKARFPYGLPASLQGGDWRRYQSPNVIDFKQWHQRRRKMAAISE
jgi:hypothetical protein